MNSNIQQEFEPGNEFFVLGKGPDLVQMASLSDVQHNLCKSLNPDQSRQNVDTDLNPIKIKQLQQGNKSYFTMSEIPQTPVYFHVCKKIYFVLPSQYTRIIIIIFGGN